MRGGAYIFAYSVVVSDPVADVLISVPAFVNKYALLASLEPSFIRFTSLVDEALSISSPFSPSSFLPSFLSLRLSLSLRVCWLFVTIFCFRRRSPAALERIRVIYVFFGALFFCILRRHDVLSDLHLVEECSGG